MTPKEFAQWLAIATTFTSGLVQTVSLQRQVTHNDKEFHAVAGDNTLADEVGR